jgi:hypothetical protein
VKKLQIPKLAENVAVELPNAKRNPVTSWDLDERRTPRTHLLPAFEDLAPLGEPVSDAGAVLLDQ